MESNHDHATLVILESSDQFAQDLADRLDRLGYRVEVFSEEVEVRERIDRGGVHVVLLGLEDHSDERLELLEWLRGWSVGTQVVALVPDGQVALSMEAMRRGAFADLTIPVDVAALVDVLGQAVATAREATRS